MSQPFSGKTVFITGGASGIGRATAIKLSSLGATVVVTDINEKAVFETVSLCPGDGHKAYIMDVSDSTAVQMVTSYALHDFGTIDHVFNCAGINPTPMRLEDTSDRYWDLLMNVNLKGLYLVTQAFVPYLNAGSSFVNVSSLCGLHPGAHMAIYCATKYGIIGFSKSMALELGSRGIRVNVVAPGYIDTPTNASVVAGEAAVKRSASRVAMGRLGRPEEIADTVAYLMGDSATFVNGAVVEINGGQNEGF